MKKMLGLTVAFVLFVFGAVEGMAQEKITEITLASEEWKNATHADGTGLYWDIFKAVFEPDGIKVKILIRSYTGAVEMVKRKRADAVVAAYADEIEEAYYPKWHFALDVVQALFKKDTGVDWKGQESMKDKKVGWIKGYALDDYLDVPVKKMEFDERNGAFRSLDKGRYDFFIDAQGDLKDALTAGIIKTEDFRIETIKQLNLYLAFAKNKKGKQLQEIFDKNFESLLKSGKIKELYKKWDKAYFTYPFD